MMGDEGEARGKAAYGTNYPRLAEIKWKYDATNLFHVNQNIRPEAPAGGAADRSATVQSLP